MKNIERVEFALIRTRDGVDRVIEVEDTKEAAEALIDWWIQGRPNPEESRKEYRVVSKITTVSYVEDPEAVVAAQPRKV